MSLVFVFFVLIVSVLGSNVPPGEIINFELQVGTVTAVGSVDIEPIPEDCLHKSSRFSQTNQISTTSIASATRPAQTRHVTETITRTVFVTINSSWSPPYSNQTRISTTTRTSGGTGALFNILPSNAIANNISLARSPVPTVYQPVISGGNFCIHQWWWYPATIIAVIISLLSF
ncbi:hypothetical protein BX600DRAFT_471250 [Xylariales sp. PMI_506]|nr:hypothetical protein BX600DRAFT_471250 [Xylariales sp. PMI_506]